MGIKKKLIIMFVVLSAVLFFASDNFAAKKNNQKNNKKTVKVAPLGYPSEKWIGKTIKINFGRFSSMFSKKSFTVKIKEVKLDKSNLGDQKYFVTEKPYMTNQSLSVDYIYFKWFNLDDGEGIVSCVEVR